MISFSPSFRVEHLANPKRAIPGSGHNPPTRIVSRTCPHSSATLPETKRLQLPHIYSERRGGREKVPNQPDDAWCIYTYVHKGPRFPLPASRVYTGGYTFLGRVPAPPRRRPGDVLFDGVSKREILTEQLSPAGIMWADGWREIRLPWNFRRTRYCSERERRRRRSGRRGRATGMRREGEDGRRVTQGIYQANFTIPDTMVPRRHWPCLTADSPLPVVTSSGYLHLHRGHIVLGGNSRRCVLARRLCRADSEEINETAKIDRVFARSTRRTHSERHFGDF